MDVRRALSFPFSFLEDGADWNIGDSQREKCTAKGMLTIAGGGCGRKPCSISFLAPSWTEVVLRDANRRLTYLFSGALVVAVVSASREGGGRSECEFTWCPQPLHFVSFDLFGTKSAHVQAVSFFEDPVQVVGMENEMDEGVVVVWW